MKKTAYFILLFLLGINFAKAQEVGIYFGTNINFLQDQLTLTYYEEGENGLTKVDRSYISDWGQEFGLTYRTDVSHAFSFEMALGMQKLETSLKEDRTLGNKKNFEEFGYSQKYIVIKPTFHYWINDNWSFTGNAILRLGTGGDFYKFDETTNLFVFDNNGIFDANHMDVSIGINYETNYGIGFYSHLQKPLINFNDSPIEDYLPTSILSFGLSFRIDKDKLSKFAN